jgi:hypothetical protein
LLCTGIRDTPRSMKLTRKIVISELVFTSQDLIRIAKVLDDQREVAKGDYIKKQYEVRFNDNTRFESDTPEVFQEELLTAHGRPVAIEMAYRNYTQSHYITVSLSHGDSSYGNEATVSAGEPAWVNANFQSLQDVLKRAKSQKVWVRRHQELLLHLIALGIGSAFFITLDLFFWLAAKMGWNVFSQPPSWVQRLSAWPWFRPTLFLTDWFARWIVGLSWGAFAVRRWLLAMWPSIEFDFGLPHLQIEKIQRRRLASVFILIIVPIFTSLLYDLIKRAF